MAPTRLPEVVGGPNLEPIVRLLLVEDDHLRPEGRRQVSRSIEHYSLPAILAVGYRVRSTRGTQFRQWATPRLTEYLVKGFTLDDERLKNPPGKDHTDYFDELRKRS